MENVKSTGEKRETDTSGYRVNDQSRDHLLGPTESDRGWGSASVLGRRASLRLGTGGFGDGP